MLSVNYVSQLELIQSTFIFIVLCEYVGWVKVTLRSWLY